MKRRSFLKMAVAALAAPRLARAESERVLRFIPRSDLTALENRKLSLLGDLHLSAAFAVIERQVEDTWFDRILARAYLRLAASPTGNRDVQSSPRLV